MLQSPTNGFITFTESSASASTQFKTTATYGCEPGFGVASGDVSRTCQDRESATPGIREWSGTDVTCEGRPVCSNHIFFCMHSVSRMHVTDYSIPSVSYNPHNIKLGAYLQIIALPFTILIPHTLKIEKFISQRLYVPIFLLLTMDVFPTLPAQLYHMTLGPQLLTHATLGLG